MNKPTGVETVSYSYDGTSNRISETWQNNQNQIVSQYTYTYQPGDYLISKTDPSSVVNYTWDIYGQLSSKSSGENYIFTGKRNLNSVTESNVVTELYMYDALGRRLKVQNADTITLNFPLGNDTSYEVKKEGADTTVTKYISANGKYLAKTVKVNANPEQKYFHHIDLVGSIRAITDDAGTVVASYEYEPFGVTVKTTGSDQDNLGFAGKRLDAGSGLSYFGARYYDAEMGRFISRDPAQDGRNWFVYCANNPLGYRDPDGLKIIMQYGVMTDDEFLRETKGDSYGKENKSVDEWNKYYSLCMTAPVFRENYLEVLNSEETFIVNVTGDGPTSSFETRSGTDEDPHLLIFNYKKIPYDAGVQKQMRLDSALNHEFGHAASEARKDMGSVYTKLYSVFDNLGTTFGSWGMKNLSKWFNDVALWLRNKAENYNINRNEKVYDKFMGYEEYRDKYSYL